MPDAPLEVSLARLEVQVASLSRTVGTLEPMVRTIAEWVAEHRGSELSRMANGHRVDGSLASHDGRIASIERTTEANAAAIKWLTRASWAENIVIVGMLVKLILGS